MAIDILQAVDMTIKLVLAGVLGGFVGYEREVHEHPAGLRTHILVCMGAALITLVSASFKPPYSDPGRIAAQIVSGIGFLGAGTILRQGSIVRGLTTAASLWTVAGIGMAVGIGGIYYWLAIVATIIMFVTLSTIRIFEPATVKKAAQTLYVEIESDGALEMLIEKLIEMDIAIHSISSGGTSLEGRRAFRIEVVLPRSIKPETVLEKLAGEKDISRLEWV